MVISIYHYKIIALYEASRKCVLLCGVINHVQQSTDIGSVESTPIIYENNDACVIHICKQLYQR